MPIPPEPISWEIGKSMVIRWLFAIKYGMNYLLRLADEVGKAANSVLAVALIWFIVSVIPK